MAVTPLTGPVAAPPAATPAYVTDLSILDKDERATLAETHGQLVSWNRNEPRYDRQKWHVVFVPMSRRGSTEFVMLDFPSKLEAMAFAGSEDGRFGWAQLLAPGDQKQALFAYQSWARDRYYGGVAAGNAAAARYRSAFDAAARGSTPAAPGPVLSPDTSKHWYVNLDAPGNTNYHYVTEAERAAIDATNAAWYKGHGYEYHGLQPTEPPQPK